MSHPLKFPEIPEPPRRPPSPPRIEPPMVFVPPRWEYRHVIRAASVEAPMAEEELNALGAEGWELAATFAAPGSVHFYFKRLVR